MKTLRIISLFFLLTVCQAVIGQQPAEIREKWKPLIGEWVGEGSGQLGQNQGTFSIQTELDGKILVRKNHTVFPSAADSPARVHDDLLILYQDSQSGQPEAIYFDNEGNTIKYKVNFAKDSIVLTSDVTQNVPGFRLSYIFIDSKTINITFEIASPQTPKDFKMYLSGKAFKVK